MSKRVSGRDALAELTAPPRVRVADVARALGVTPQAVDQWVRGVRVPRPEYREALRRHYGIAPESWEES